MIEILEAPQTRKTLSATPDMVGKYINRVLWSDVDPVGKIIGIKGKNTLICCRVTPSQNLTPMNELGFIAGGFVGTYVNQYAQRYEFTEDMNDIFEIRYSRSMTKDKFLHIDKSPFKFYDYNF
jgi:hypothetical protein